MTDLKVSGLEECWEKETGQIVESSGVLVTTHETFATVVSRKHLTLDQCRLVIVDNVQASFQPGGSSPLVSLYNSVARNQAPRLVTITPHLLASNTDPGLSSLPRQLSSLASLILSQRPAPRPAESPEPELCPGYSLSLSSLHPRYKATLSPGPLPAPARQSGLTPYIYI